MILKRISLGFASVLLIISVGCNWWGEGSREWRFNTKDDRAGLSAPAIGNNGTIYCANHDLYAIDSDGKLIWQSEHGSEAPVIGSDGTIFTVEGATVYALDPSVGSVKWSYETTGALYARPALGEDGTVYVGSAYLGNPERYLYAISSDGTMKWRVEPPGMSEDLANPPSVAADGTIYIGETNLWAFNPDGTIKWTCKDVSVWTTPVIDSDGTIYVCSSRELHAVDPDGNLKWSYKVEDRVYSSPSIGPNGTICFCSDDGYLYVINSDSTLKWRYETGVGTRYVSPAIDEEGTVYIGANDGFLYAINSDATLRWRYEIGTSMSSPAIGSDGTIYVSSSDGYLYAIRGSAPLADSPWPMVGHDPQHTGRAGTQ